MNNDAMIQRIAEPLYAVKGWMKLAGIVSIIQGVFTALSIWGLVICWLPIWMGTLLMGASKHITAAFETNDEAQYLTSMEKLAKYFKLMGILLIILVAVFIIGIVAAITIPALLRARQAAG